MANIILTIIEIRLTNSITNAVCIVVSLFGTVSNVINLIVFYRQGLDTPTNISFFAIAISDLCSLTFQQFYNLFENPLFVNRNLPIVYGEIQFLTASVTREVFAQITCLITVYITAERCLCVVFPLHIKRLVTPKTAIIVISVNYIAVISHALPLYLTSYFTWKFYPELNSSLLGLAFTTDHVIAEAVVYFNHALFTLLGFMSVVILTLILIYQLEKNNKWRQTKNTSQEKSKLLSKRDRATVTMVVLIAGILVVCYTPTVLLGLTTCLEPTFSVAGKHHDLFHNLWYFAMFLEAVNSSVNIFVYYRMSSRYRQTCNQLFSAERRFVTLDISAMFK